MSDEQRPLSGYKSKVHEGGEYENPNIGKPVLSEYDEYVLKLTRMPVVKSFQAIKDKKDGTKVTTTVDKAICEFSEEQTGNVVNAFFRVDSLNFSDDDAFSSGVVRFFKKIGTPLPEPKNDAPFDRWGEFFIVGMRFRGRVVPGKGQDQQTNPRYYLDVPTCRPLSIAEKHQETVSQAPAQRDESAIIANIKFIIKNCKTKDDAMIELMSAKVPTETMQVFLAAVKDGRISFPV